MIQKFEDVNNLLEYIDSDIDCLIFDLDGTIADSMPLHIEAWKEMGQFYGAEITTDMINQFAGSPTSKVIKTLNEAYGWSMEVEYGSKMKSELFANKLDNIDAIAPLEPMWEIAKKYKSKIPICIGTGSGRVNASKTIRLMGAEDFFDYVVTATDVENHKPHPETFLLSAERFNIAPSKCLVFEDGRLGVDAGLAGGMNVVFIPEFEFYTP